MISYTTNVMIIIIISVLEQVCLKGLFQVNNPCQSHIGELAPIPFLGFLVDS